MDNKQQTFKKLNKTNYISKKYLHNTDVIRRRSLYFHYN